MLNARNVVVFDNAGIPSIMVKFSKCTNADLFPRGSEQTHPAFIVDGEEVDAIYIAKYPCTMINGKPYSLPHMKPATEISYAEAAAACFSKGEGWHLLTAPEYALAALESAKGNTEPRGNTRNGASHSHPEEKGERYDNSGRTLTGSGPATWAHDHTPYGVYDLCGNVWEWIAGLRLQDGEIQIIPDNNAANTVDMSGTSPLWQPVLVDGKPTRFIAEDGEIKLTNEGNSEDWDGCAWRELDIDIEAPELLKAIALYPTDIENTDSYLYIDGDGERLPIRGGFWLNGAGAGVFALSLADPRSYVYTLIGFRAAFYRKAGN